MSGCYARLRALRTEGAVLPRGSDGRGQDDSAGLPADHRGKSGILPDCTAFPHRLGVLSSCLSPSKGPLPPQTWGVTALFPLAFSLTEEPGLEGRSSRAEDHVGGRVPASPQPKQQLAFKARARATLPLTSWVALDKASLPRASVSHSEAEIGAVGLGGGLDGPGSGMGHSIYAGR